MKFYEDIIESHEEETNFFINKKKLKYFIMKFSKVVLILLMMN